MKQDFSAKKTAIDFTLDSIVVKKFNSGVLGGVMLDVTNYSDHVVNAGQCVITDGNGVYKPMPILGETYGAMPEGFHYVGVVYRTAKVSEPVSIMFRGVVNKEKAPYYFKSDFNVFGIILSSDLDETDPFANYLPISDVANLPSGADAKNADIIIGAAVNDFASADYFRNIVVRDAEVSKTITLKAKDNITLDGVSLSGGKDGSNGKITFAANQLNIKNITAKEGTTLYNAFEGYQKINDPEYTGIKKLVAENLNIDCPSLTHNIINVYTPADGAEIIIKNSKFNLTVDNSNILRMSNYLNAENVKIRFENCDWTYENGLSFNDWKWAGLMIYQPAASDVALNGDLSKMLTWEYEFINCRYNGQKVMSNGYGDHEQVFYFYNVNNSGNVSVPVSKSITFK